MTSVTQIKQIIEYFFLNISKGNIHNSKDLLEHHLEFQSPRFKVSPPGQSKLQTLKHSVCLLCKALGSCLVILDHLGHSSKEV